jgi:primosomal protein N' (replication factor Y)
MMTGKPVPDGTAVRTFRGRRAGGRADAQPLDRVLDYRAPEGGCWLGAFVEVPLGPRKVLGVVWGPGRAIYDAAKMRR